MNKYDGYQFTTYHHIPTTNSLVANDIRTLYFDKKMNALWVGTTAGLCRLRLEYGDFVNYEQLTELHENNSLIHTFFRDSKDRLWVGTDNGLFLYRKETDSFIRFAAEKNIPHTLSGNEIKVIHEDKKGTLWFGSVSGLDTLENTNKDKFKFGYVSQTNKFPDRHIKGLSRTNGTNIPVRR